MIIIVTIGVAMGDKFMAIIPLSIALRGQIMTVNQSPTLAYAGSIVGGI